MKRLLSIGVFALALTAGGANAADIFIRFGPPPPPREYVVVQPGPGYVWMPGYYESRGRNYKWKRGRWMRPPRGRTVFVPGYWQQQRRGNYIYVSGYWR